MLTAVEQRVWDRDQGRCVRHGGGLFGERGYQWSIHHRRPRKSGGSKVEWINLPANLVLLCGSGVMGCHGWVENNRHRATERGFLVPMGKAVATSTPILHAVHGWVLLDDEGGFTPARNKDKEWAHVEG